MIFGHSRWLSLFIIILSSELLKTIRYLCYKNTCDTLPSECKYVDYSRKSNNELRDKFENKEIEIICLWDSFFTRKSLLALETTWMKCPRQRRADEIQISFKSSSSSSSKRLDILNDSFADVFKLGTFTANDSTTTITNLGTFTFFNIKGFEIDSVFYVHNYKALQFTDHFNLYNSDRLIRNCQDYQEASGGSSSSSSNNNSFIFRSPYANDHEKNDEQNSAASIIVMRFYRPKSVYPICSMFFHNAILNEFTISTLVDTYFRKHLITFSTIRRSTRLPRA